MNEQVLEEDNSLGKIYTVLFNNIKHIYEDSVGLIKVLRSINDEKKIRAELVTKELEIMQTLEAAEKIENELQTCKDQLEIVRQERDQYKSELDGLNNQVLQQKSQIQDVQEQLQIWKISQK